MWYGEYNIPDFANAQIWGNWRMLGSYSTFDLPDLCIKSTYVIISKVIIEIHV